MYGIKDISPSSVGVGRGTPTQQKTSRTAYVREALENNDMPILYTISDLSRSRKTQERFSLPSTQSCHYRGRLFPSGRITIGRIGKKKIIKSDIEYEANRPLVTYGTRSHWHYEHGLVREYYQREDRPQTLGLSDVQICHNDEKRVYGARGIGRQARNTILECATVLQTKYGRKLGFYTLTCPYSDERLIWEYNRCFSEIVRRFFQEVRREYKRKHIAYQYIAVFEVQPERFQSSGIPVLHLHWLSPCYVPGTWQFVLSADEIRSIYQRVLGSVVSPNADVSAALDAQVIHKSASGYLAKYLSKGGLYFGEDTDVIAQQCPRRWWSVSKSLLKAVKSATVELSQDLCSYLIYSDTATVQQSLSAYYCKSICINWNKQEMIVGLSMAVPNHIAQDLRPPNWKNNICEQL